ALSFGEGETVRGLILLGVAALGGCGLVLVPAKPGEKPTDPWPQARQLLPAFGIIVSSVFGVAYWLRHAPDTSLIPPVTLDIFLVGLAGVSTRRGVTAPAVFLAAVASAVLGFVIFANESFALASTHYDTWAVAVAGVIALAGLGAGLPREMPYRGLVQGTG